MTLEAEPRTPELDLSAIDRPYIQAARAKIREHDLQRQFDSALADLERYAKSYLTAPAATKPNHGAFFQRASTSIRMALIKSGVPAESPDPHTESARTIADKIMGMYEAAAGYSRREHARE